jgi:hypothetical protein
LTTLAVGATVALGAFVVGARDDVPDEGATTAVGDGAIAPELVGNGDVDVRTVSPQPETSSASTSRAPMGRIFTAYLWSTAIRA